MPVGDDGQMAEAAVDHQHGRVLGGLLRLDRLRAARHPVADDRVRGEPFGHRAEHVALGEDADEALAVEHEHGSDAPRVHLAHRADERCRLVDRRAGRGTCTRRRRASMECRRFPAEFLVAERTCWRGIESLSWPSRSFSPSCSSPPVPRGTRTRCRRSCGARPRRSAPRSSTDVLGTTIATVKGTTGGRTLALFAHADQVAMSVRDAGERRAAHGRAARGLEPGRRARAARPDHDGDRRGARRRRRAAARASSRGR